MEKIILASGSPRRKEILENAFAIKPEVVVSGVEEVIDETLSPGDLVLELAYQKGVEISVGNTNVPVISGDTVVSLNRQILGKPKDEKEAIQMLTLLSGKCHQVYTGHCIFYKGKAVKGLSTSNVYFRSLSEVEILNYVETGEPLDKAGAYGIQGLASVFIEKIEGDFYGIMGLSPYIINELFQRIGRKKDENISIL